MTLEVNILRVAEEIALTPGSLTRFAEGRMGRSIFAHPCRWDHPHAQSWCAIGIIKRATAICIGNPPHGQHRHRTDLMYALVDRANRQAKMMGYASVSALNDFGGPRKVRELFRVMKGRAR